MKKVRLVKRFCLHDFFNSYESCMSFLCFYPINHFCFPAAAAVAEIEKIVHTNEHHVHGGRG